MSVTAKDKEINFIIKKKRKKEGIKKTKTICVTPNYKRVRF